jgi:hypothetical protein
LAPDLAAAICANGMIRIAKDKIHDVSALRVEREFRGIDDFIYCTLKAARDFLIWFVKAGEQVWVK